MSIPASELVDILPRVIGGGLNGIEENGVFLTTSSLVPTGVAYPFADSDSVGDYFGTNNAEYSLSVNYFTADINKQKLPSVLYFYKYIGAAVAAWIRGATLNNTLAEFQTITDGALNIAVNGTEVTLTGINLSEANSYSAIAQEIQTALTAVSAGATVTYNSLFNAFVVTSGTTGEASTIAYPTTPDAGTDLAVYMQLYELNGAILSQGSDAQSVIENMQNLTLSTLNWVSFMPIFQETDDQKLEFANWTNSQGTRFIYTAIEVNGNALVPNNASSFAQQVRDYFGVLNIYNTKAVGAFAMGVIASTDYARTNGRKTLAYRSQTGLASSISDRTSARALLANGYNFYGDYATASDQFVSFQNGQISGPARWADTYAGQIWLKASLQAVWLTLMQNANTLPFNEVGYSSVRTASLDTINAALNNGIIVPGVTLSQTQKDQVEREAGFDISESLFNQGWYLQIPDASTQVRIDRGPLQPNFWYCDGGSIQVIKGTSTTIL